MGCIVRRRLRRWGRRRFARLRFCAAAVFPGNRSVPCSRLHSRLRCLRSLRPRPRPRPPRRSIRSARSCGSSPCSIDLQRSYSPHSPRYSPPHCSPPRPARPVEPATPRALSPQESAPPPGVRRVNPPVCDFQFPEFPALESVPVNHRASQGCGQARSFSVPIHHR